MHSNDLEVRIEHKELRYASVSICGNGADRLDCDDVRTGLLAGSFQERVGKWLEFCFGESKDPLRRERRGHRFCEESLEFLQSIGTTKEDVLSLVDYVYSRPTGEPSQEVGGVMVTLMGAASANGLKVAECAEKELARVWEKAADIFAKNKRQVRGSPLPGASEPKPVELDPRTGRPYVDHGTALQAMQFAIDCRDICGEEKEFISAWLEGNLEDFPEFYDYLRGLEAGK